LFNMKGDLAIHRIVLANQDTERPGLRLLAAWLGFAVSV